MASENGNGAESVVTFRITPHVREIIRLAQEQLAFEQGSIRPLSLQRTVPILLLEAAAARGIKPKFNKANS